MVDVPLRDSVKADLYVREYGSRTPEIAILVHGHAQSGRVWNDLAIRLAASGRRVLVPDLPGIGRSAVVPAGHRKRAVAGHLRQAMAPHLAGASSVSIVGHDLGAMVAYAWAAQWPAEIDRLCLLETPIAGLPPWDELLKMPQAWHFGFQGPFASALVADREEIYLSRFWTEMAVDPTAIQADDRAEYVEAYRTPGAMEASFDYFATFAEDARDNLELTATPLVMPVLTIGGEHGMNEAVGEQARLYAADVTDVVIAGAAHFPIDENPDAVFAALDRFLPRTRGSS